MRLYFWKTPSGLFRIYRLKNLIFKLNLLIMGMIILLIGSKNLHADKVKLHFRTQIKTADENGYKGWETIETEKEIETNEGAIIICDVWEEKGCRAHVERIGIMAPIIDDFISIARNKGFHIIHAPSAVMEYYKDFPPRKRIVAAPFVPTPKEKSINDVDLPVESHGVTCDSEGNFGRVERQHPAIVIDQDHDVISDKGQEIWNYIQLEDIKNVFILGVHTNMCILTRPFAIQQMVKWGVNIYLIRDLTDASYNPFTWPYINQREGTELAVEYIEKFWCPSVSMTEISGIPEFSYFPWRDKESQKETNNVKLAESRGVIYKDPTEKLYVSLNSQRKGLDRKKLNIWEKLDMPGVFNANETAIIIMNMYDRMDSPEATNRINTLSVEINEFVNSLRRKEVKVIHTPTGCIEYYQNEATRESILNTPVVPLPSTDLKGARYLYLHMLQRPPYKPDSSQMNVIDPPYPLKIDHLKDNSDDIQIKQHPEINIDLRHDVISDSEQEIWNFVIENDIDNVLVVGFLSKGNILKNSFSLKKLISMGLNVVVVKDLIEIAFDPYVPPYVNYDRGKKYVVDYIEKFWCTTCMSNELLR